MTKLIGRLESVGIGKETTRGTAAAAGYWLQWLELSLDNKITVVPNESSLARIEDSDDSTITEKYGEATVKMKLKDTSLGLLLLATLGTCTSAAKAAPNAAVYDHVFTANNGNAHQSLTLSHKSSNDDKRYVLGMVESLTLEITPDNYPTVEAVLISKAAAAATNTVAHVAENDFLGKHLSFKMADDASGLTAATATVIKSATIEIAKNLMPEYDLGSNEPVEILNQSLSISGSLTVVHDGTTFSALNDAGTKKALRFQFTHTATIGDSSKPALLIDLNKVTFSNYSRSMSLNDLVEETVDFKAHYDIADAAMITATLTNLVAAY